MSRDMSFYVVFPYHTVANVAAFLPGLSFFWPDFNLCRHNFGVPCRTKFFLGPLALCSKRGKTLIHRTKACNNITTSTHHKHQHINISTQHYLKSYLEPTSHHHPQSFGFSLVFFLSFVISRIIGNSLSSNPRYMSILSKLERLQMLTIFVK